MDNEIIKKAVDKIINSDSLLGYTIVGVILTGSYAHGDIHKKSDIDIYVVVSDNISFIRHVIYHVDKKLVQVRICSYEYFRCECEKYDNKRPASYACKILLDKEEMCKSAINCSKKYLDWGPKKLSVQEEKKLASTIKNEIETIEGLLDLGNYVSANILIDNLVIMNIEYYNNEHNYWMSNYNYLFKEFCEHDEKIGALVSQIILTKNVSEKFEKLKYLCALVIKEWDYISGDYVYDEYNIK